MVFKILIFILVTSLQLSAHENLCSRIVTDFIQKTGVAKNLDELAKNNRKSIAPVSDFFTTRDQDIAKYFVPVIEKRSKVLSSSKNRSAAEKYLKFHTDNKSILVPEDLISFLGADQDAAALLKKQRNYVYLNVKDYDAANELGHKLYDSYQKFKYNKCSFENEDKSPPCISAKNEIKSLQLKLLPYFVQARSNAQELDQLETTIGRKELTELKGVLSLESSARYESTKSENVKNYQLLVALEKFSDSSALKVETFKLTHTNGDTADLHLIKSTDGIIRGVVFGEPIKTVITKDCQDFYLLFDINESNNYFKKTLLGNADYRLMINSSKSGLVQNYSAWAKEAELNLKSRANSESSGFSIKKYLPSFLTGTNR